MRPTPQRLALLMSVAGLGLSLGATARADIDQVPYSRFVAALGLPRPSDDGFASAELAQDGLYAQAPSSRLDGTLEAPDEALMTAVRRAVRLEAYPGRHAASPGSSGGTPPLSRRDRDAIALAMVLMAEPPSDPAVMPTGVSPTHAPPVPEEPVAPSPAAVIPLRQPDGPPVSIEHWEWTVAPGRDLQDAPRAARELDETQAPDKELTHPPGTFGNDRAAVTPVASRARETSGVNLDLDLNLNPGLDLNLDLGLNQVLDIDLNLNIGLNQEFGLDLNLDVSLTQGMGLDLNLNLGPGLDLNLDLGLGLGMDLHLGQDLDLNLDLVSAPASTLAPNVGLEAIAAPPGAGRFEASCSAEAASRSADQAPEIVVASHADRVMRSLEALLSGDDPASRRFGAQTPEVMVTSHAEKALLVLAATRQRGGSMRRSAVEPFVYDLPLSAAPEQTSISAAVSEPSLSHTKSEPARELSDQPRRIHRSPMGEGLLALSERNLDQVRGGFVTDSGLQISFGIERAVYINGSLVTTTSLNVSDLGKVTGGQMPVSAGNAGSVSTSAGTVALIQNGVGNTFVNGAVSAASLGTVIQNTLNDQKIQSVTLINATVNSLQLLKSQTFGSSLRSAVIDSLRR